MQFKKTITSALLLFGAAFMVLTPLKAEAAAKRGVTVLTLNKELGAVNATCNDRSFQHYTYCDENDYIKVTAVVRNKEASFLYWYDNGRIVSRETTYTFSPRDKDRTVLAVFELKKEAKKYHYKKTIFDVTPNTNPVSFAPGYKRDGITITPKLITPDEPTRLSGEQLTKGTFSCMLKLDFTGANNKYYESLPETTKVVAYLPDSEQKDSSRTYWIIPVTGGEVQILKDEDHDPATITFPAKKSCSYFVAYTK